MVDRQLSDEVWARTRAPLPLPGYGDTLARFEALAAIASVDLALAKLVEPHHDATAILADLGAAPPDPQSLWAVWAAEPPYARLTAVEGTDGWRLSGRKAFCSGATMVTAALVTAEADDGPRLFAVDVDGQRSGGALEIGAADWVGTGMRRADTRTTVFDDVEASAVGPPGGYVDRPGFWYGAVGVAACWLGGARAVGAQLEHSGRRRRLDDHASAHLGAVTAALDAATAHLRTTSALIDEDPLDTRHLARRHAQSCRATAAAVVDAVLARTGRAVGPAPLAFDREHAQRVADLEVFVRQHHAERDLADLGRLVAEQADADA